MEEFRTYKGELSQKDKYLLIALREELFHKSSSQFLRKIQNQRNHSKTDPVFETSLLHGVRDFTIQKLDSILSNGILCAEFLNQYEDGETFFHADFFMSGEHGVSNLMNAINNAPSTIFQKNIYTQMKTSGLIPAFGRRYKSVALIVNPTRSWNYIISTQKNKNKIGGKFINYMPHELHVAVLGGVPSTEISGMIISDTIDRNEIMTFLIRKGIYIPIFDTTGNKLF